MSYHITCDCGTSLHSNTPHIRCPKCKESFDIDWPGDAKPGPIEHIETITDREEKETQTNAPK